MKIPSNEDLAGNSISNSTEITGKKSSIEDLVTILRQFSRILELANSQEPELSNAVGKLANIISRYREKSIDEVLDGLTIARRMRSVKPLPQVRISESEAKSLTSEQIERLLESEEIGKADLITIAMVRFGMSRAELMKTKKAFIIEGIRTAISNLRTIEIIGKQASGEK
jgi:integrase